MGMRTPPTVRVLLTAGALRRVLTAYLLYGLGGMSIWLAILLWAYDEGGAGMAGFVAVAQLLPAAVIAPPLAALSDRFSRGTSLAVAHLAVALTTSATTVALLVDAGPAVVVAASAGATTALAVVRPLHFAALPQLADGPDDLVSANALSAAADGAALTVGPLLAGLGAHVAGPWLVFSAASLVAFTATALCGRTGLRRPRVRRVDTPSRSWRAGPAEAVSIVRDRAALVLLVVLATKFVVEGAHDVLGVALSDALDLGSSGAGVIVGAMGFGGLIGGIVSSYVVRGGGLSRVVLGSGAGQGVAIALVAVFASLAPVVVLVALAGMAGAVLMVAGRTLLQRTADERALARVFAVQEATSLLGLAIGAALAPLLIDLVSARGAFVPFGAGAALLIALGWLLVRELDDRAVLLPEETALLRGVQFLGVLPAYELERLARSAGWVTVTAGEDVVREGETGSVFYVVADGELEVRVRDEARASHLGRGDSFGEIALLRAVPRTATVTALAASRLLTLGSEDFLAAVTGSPSGESIAAEVTDGHLARDRT
jgi:MFS family permease